MHSIPGPVFPVLALAACVAVLAGCDRQPASNANGDSQQVAAAKAAVERKLGTSEPAEFRYIAEYRDGVVCGEFNAKKMFSGTDMGFRRFIYNAPDPGELAIDSGELSPQEVSFWCSDQPDKRLRMLTASVAELTQACAAAGNKASDLSCRLAATQKQALDAIKPPGRPADTATASAGQASAPAPAAVAAVAAAPAPAAVPSAPVAVAVAAAPAPSAPPAPAATAAAPATIPVEVDRALQAWRERWQQGDIEGYLRMYEASFTGGTGSHGEWEQQRRRKMKNVHPSITVQRLQPVRITPDEVELRFVQVYSASQHRDTGNKTMVWRRSPQGWLIADERWAAL